MYYLDTPITDTDADAIVVPVSLRGTTQPGSLQSQVIAALGDEYLEDYLGQLKKGHLQPGKPSLYWHNDKRFPGVINFPVENLTGREIWLSDIVRGLSAMFVGLKSEPIHTVAVPWLGREYSWDTLEWVLHRMEEIHGDEAKVVLWLYPPSDDEEDGIRCRVVDSDAQTNIVESAVGCGL